MNIMIRYIEKLLTHRKVLNIAGLIFLFVAASSCSDEYVAGDLYPTTDPYYLNYDKSSLAFSSAAGKQSVQIRSYNTPWTVSTTSAWIKLSASQGTGDAELQITVDENKEYSTSSRVGVLTLSSSSGKHNIERNLTITQEAPSEYLDIDQSEIKLDGSASEISIAVSSNNTWQYKISGGTWLTVSQSKEGLKLKVDENTGKESRYAVITVSTSSIAKTIHIEQNPAVIDEPEVPYVDLGLSVKWAKCNVGASLPEEVGTYFAWGETSSKANYAWSTYRYSSGTANSLLKYNDDADFGKVDNQSRLSVTDDAATSLSGSEWRMPTLEEFYELSTKCTHKYTTINGVKGIKITGPNGNTIFLPAAGYMNGTSLTDSATDGWYWTSESASACHFSENVALLNYNINWTRCYGFNIRAVLK